MEMLDKVLNLLTGCFPQGFDPAKINSIGLHQVGIELVLADDLAKVIADFGPAVVFISRLAGACAPVVETALTWQENRFLRLSRCRCRKPYGELCSPLASRQRAFRRRARRRKYWRGPRQHIRQNLCRSRI